MTKTEPANTATDAPAQPPAVGALLERVVGRPVDSGVTACTGFAQVVDGPKPQGLQWDDEDDEPADQCLHCRGDGMDPDCDYLLPCPDCGGSW
jgi:hypothetical protein